MSMQARAVVVGGGVIGASVAYHLAKKGWSDVILCEREELTSGATWRAAGHVILYTLNRTINLLNRYSVDLYKELLKETGQDPGFHVCGNLRLLTEPSRLEEFNRFIDLAALNGIDARLMSPAEIGKIWPLLSIDGLLGGLLTPGDGHISPADLTMALIAGARKYGAKILRQTDVTGFEREGNEWRVQTTKGEIACEHVISCSGLHTYRTMKMVGLEAHAIPIRHQYLITEPIPELEQRRRDGLPELAVMRDPDQSFYVRQEGVSLLFGAYENTAHTLFPYGVAEGFRQENFPDALDVLLPYLEAAVKRVPILETSGIQTIVPGVKPYSPDDLPITGPAPGLCNFWLAEGNPFGVTLAGGIGWQLSEWITEGGPTIDMLDCDPRRFAGYASRPYVAAKTSEAYERTYLIPGPDEELPAGRPLRTAPLYDELTSRGASFGCLNGWEVPNFFILEDPLESTQEAARVASAIKRESRIAAHGVGICETSHTTKLRLIGCDALEAIERLVCSAVPQIGHATRAYTLNSKGRITSSFVLAREAESSFLIAAENVPETYLIDVLSTELKRMHLDAMLQNITASTASLRIVGPGADAHMSGVINTGNELDLPERCAVSCTVGLAPAFLVRASRSWEIFTSSEYQRHVFKQLTSGALASIAMVGAKALANTRYEEGDLLWGQDISPSRTMIEAGLASVVQAERSFVGSEAFRKQSEDGARLLLVAGCLPSDANALVGSAPVLDERGRVVGLTTSASRAHGGDRNMYRAYLEVDSLDAFADGKLRVSAAGKVYPTTKLL